MKRLESTSGSGLFLGKVLGQLSEDGRYNAMSNGPVRARFQKFDNSVAAT
jgi:hypothetical protein